ncbi:MAG: ester cyclase, partial [Gemmatimonadaceae bacterium]
RAPTPILQNASGFRRARRPEAVMSEVGNLAAIRRQFGSWNDGDWAGLSRDVADGYLMDSDTNVSPVVGKDGMRQYARTLHTGFPDLRFDLIEVFGNGDMVTATWIASATHRGDFRGLASTGRRIELHGCTVSRFRDGRIARQHSYWDMATLRRQLGAPVPRVMLLADAEISIGDAGRDF